MRLQPQVPLCLHSWEAWSYRCFRGPSGFSTHRNWELRHVCYFKLVSLVIQQSITSKYTYIQLYISLLWGQWKNKLEPEESAYGSEGSGTRVQGMGREFNLCKILFGTAWMLYTFKKWNRRKKVKKANSNIDAKKNSKPSSISNREHNRTNKELIQVTFERGTLPVHHLEGYIIKIQRTAKKSWV